MARTWAGRSSSLSRSTRIDVILHGQERYQG